MKKAFLFVLGLTCGMAVYSQSVERPWLQGLSGGVGVPMEFYDLKAAGASLHIGYDFAYPITDKFAMGIYLSGGGGFLGGFHKEYDDDNYFSTLKISAGLLMEIGELTQRPFIIGVSPCTGFGLLDMDLILPVEIRFGRFVSDNWYVTGELVYGISLAAETVSLEPAIRVGYNFGHKVRPRKRNR